MDINHKAVYECREIQVEINSAQAAVRAAQAKVDKANSDYRAMCAKVADVPIEKLEFSNVGCMAQGITRHVYLIKIPSPHGSPENQCIFCGCDNFDC